jgi:acetolactate synthase I/II/III large subunit
MWHPAPSELPSRLSRSKIAEGFGCHCEYVEENEMGPAIERAFASGKTAVVHVCIDPKANSEEMPKYDEFRTWYAEGTQ